MSRFAGPSKRAYAGQQVAVAAVEVSGSLGGVLGEEDHTSSSLVRGEI